MFEHARISVTEELRLHSIHPLKAEIVSQVTDVKQQKLLSQEEAWAKVLNMSLGESIRDTSHQHLMERGSTVLKALYGVYWGASAVELGSSGIDPSVVSDNLFQVAMFGVIFLGLDAVSNKSMHGETLLKERRLSLLVYAGQFQPEKHIVTSSALTRVLPVVRYRE